MRLPFGKKVVSSKEHQRRASKHDLERWQHLIGIAESMEGKILTKTMLERWSKDPRRQLRCVFCGGEHKPDTAYCIGCKTYKGMQPYIEGWS